MWVLKDLKTRRPKVLPLASFTDNRAVITLSVHLTYSTVTSSQSATAGSCEKILSAAYRGETKKDQLECRRSDVTN